MSAVDIVFANFGFEMTLPTFSSRPGATCVPIVSPTKVDAADITAAFIASSRLSPSTSACVPDPAPTSIAACSGVSPPIAIAAIIAAASIGLSKAYSMVSPTISIAGSRISSTAKSKRLSAKSTPYPAISSTASINGLTT